MPKLIERLFGARTPQPAEAPERKRSALAQLVGDQDGPTRTWVSPG